jgi:hypothetical protein
VARLNSSGALFIEELLDNLVRGGHSYAKSGLTGQSLRKKEICGMSDKELTPAGVVQANPLRTTELPGVEALELRLIALVGLRQELRLQGAEWADLERNRLEIVRLQQELLEALIEQHLGPQQAA